MDNGARPVQRGVPPFHFLLGRLRLLNWDQVIGNLVYTLGLLALAASVLGGFYFSWKESPEE